MTDFEFYETPETFTRYLFSEVVVAGNVFEPCVGSGAIIRASQRARSAEYRRWCRNDIDPAWVREPRDAREGETWRWATDWLCGPIDWTVTNPPFSHALEILEQALVHSRLGVAMLLRISFHEVLRTGPRRTFLRECPPTGILFLPRFAFQRSKTTGAWTTDNVAVCWTIWQKTPEARPFIRYAPEWVLAELEKETPVYRERMDQLMGRTGSEAHRRAIRVAV